MNVSIIVLTPDRSLSTLIDVRKASLIPDDIRRKYPSISVTSFPLTAFTALDDLAGFFAHKSTPGIIVSCDNRYGHLVTGLATTLFTVTFDHALGGKNAHNYFTMIFSRIVRAFAAFQSLFDDEKTRKLLILPLRNFSADELTELHGLFRNGVVIDGNFRPTLERLLKTLSSRRKPKVNTTRSKTYYVDDGDRYFEYGNEIHAQLETSIPPHNRVCAIAGIYRFGKRYDPKRHFNVSRQGERIQGTFHDCHGTSGVRGPCSHINMFPNDFFGAN